MSEVVLNRICIGVWYTSWHVIDRKDVLSYDHPSICGRDQLAFRSYYHPVKDVIDGDLCETFICLDAATQKRIAEELDRTPGEVAKKLEDMRNRLL